MSTTEPGRSADTRPSPVTTATLTSLVLHTSARPGSGLFMRSSGIAATARFLPATTDLGGSAMSTAATRAGNTGMTMLARASSSPAAPATSAR